MSKCDQDAAGDRSASSGCDSRAVAGVGQWLQARRVAMGVSVSDLGRALKLQGFYIEALEAESFERLPARTYAVGYVRSMAQALARWRPPQAATTPVVFGSASGASFPGQRHAVAGDRYRHSCLWVLVCHQISGYGPAIAEPGR
jgi:hypothetical protein